MDNSSFEILAKQAYEAGNYEEYVNYARREYNLSKNQSSLEELQKAEKYLKLYNEIQDIIKLENRSSYEILGISSNSSINEIKRIFREKASRYHPDRAPVKGSHDAFRIIQMAYFNINTEEKKFEYDAKDNKKRRPSSAWQSDFYNNLRSDNFYRTGNGESFVFTASLNSQVWPLEFYYQDLANVYSSLYRNRFYSRNNSRVFDSRHSLGFFILLFIFIILNILL